MPRARSHRRAAVVTGLLAALLIALVLSAANAAPTPLRVSAAVSPTPTGQALPPGFVGLSLEYSAIHRYLGRDPHALNPLFLALVSALAPGGSPVLRIGGDSSDHTWWPMPGVVEPAGVSYALTPDWLATVHAAAGALDARLILGVNLAADNPALAGVEARALLAGIGGKYVDALEIGNEPDVYTRFAWYRTRTRQVGFARGGGWTEPAFLAEFHRWARALPAVPLAGPADAYTDWMAKLSGLLAAPTHLGVVTFHRYPLRSCGAQARGSQAATIPNLLAPAASAGLAASVAPFVAVSHAAGLPFRIDELNSASCGGQPGVSNTFASALWVLDTLFQMASVGVDGVNIHTLPGAAYAPFSFTHVHGVWHATVNPLYYGLRLFTQAFPAGARLLPSSSTATQVKVWSTLATDGTIHTVVINEAANPAVVRLHITGRGGHPLSVERLTAPALTSTTGVQLGGADLAPDTTSATLGAAHLTQLRSLLGEYQLNVPADSAALLTS
ncbi:MAG TPA: glycosyl hydrolase family 79 C-terminal domain-containing protein [Solirubrobacteraceae bacterium]|nr:glycosyl hydrolase family 79 C-terminal domain-containing protein [Solirubrobacteraceae bacterium]